MSLRIKKNRYLYIFIIYEMYDRNICANAPKNEQRKKKQKNKKVKFLHIMQMCKLFLANTGLTEGPLDMFALTSRLNFRKSSLSCKSSSVWLLRNGVGS